MLLLITATFSRCFGVTSSYKGTITKLGSKKVRLQKLGDYEIYKPQALSSALASLGATAQGLWVINTVVPFWSLTII